MDCKLVSNKKGTFLVFECEDAVYKALAENPGLDYISWACCWDGYMNALQLHTAYEMNQEFDSAKSLNKE